MKIRMLNTETGVWFELDIPDRIIQAAAEVEHWMQDRGKRNWQLGGVCERSFAHRTERLEKEITVLKASRAAAVQQEQRTRAECNRLRAAVKFVQSVLKKYTHCPADPEWVQATQEP